MLPLLLLLCGTSFCSCLSSLTKCTILHDEDERGVHVDCHGRGLTEIPQHFPANTTSINLSHNGISSVKNYSFIDVPKLWSLDLSSNDISSIEPHAFFECDSLKNLKTKANKICLNDSVFEHLVYLQELAIDDCYAAEVLKPLRDLTVIEVVVNGECHFEGFHYLVKLSNLLISGLFSCRNDTFENLGKLSVRSLSIEAGLPHMGIRALEPLKHLQELRFSGTKTGIYVPLDALHALVGRNLSTLVIDKARNNEASKYLMEIEDRSLTKERLKYLCQICVSNLSMQNNMILFIDVEYMENSQIAKCLKHVDLRRNMIASLTLLEVFQFWKFTALEYIDVSDQGKLPSKSSPTPDTYPSSYVSMWDTQWKGFILSLPEILNTVKIRGNTNSMGHMIFDMSVRNGQRLKKVDVSFNGLSTLKHIYGAPNVEFIDLSGNGLLALPNNFFCSLKNVETLKMSEMSMRQYIIDTQAKVFLRCLPKVKHFDISGNRLIHLPSDLFKLNPLLEYLDLSGNIFITIPVQLNLLPNLHLLDVSSNSFGSLDKKTTDDIDNHYQNTRNMFQLDLNQNFFECSCANLPFLSWLTDAKVLADDTLDLTCITEDGNITKTKEITNNMLKFWRKCKGSGTFSISVILGTLSLCCIFVALLIDTNKTKFAFFLMNALKYQVPKRKRKDFKRDLYLSYADADYRWACLELGATLEKRNLNLFIWDRDSVPGDCTAEVITETVNQCWKTILYFTENYERDAWSYLTTMAAVNCVDNLYPERLILLLPENENPQVPECLLQVVPESCIFHVPREIRRNDAFWDELERVIKKDT